jgi:putative hydrolase of the HAD superfamily
VRIDAVLFDMGGTIEDVYYDRELRLKASYEVINYLAGEGIALDAAAETVLAAIERGCADYRAWSERTMIEAPATRVWSEWYLREFGIDKRDIDRVAEDLAMIWETKFYARSLRPEALGTLEALAARGYRLGVISNTSSATQVFSSLERYGIRGFFDCVCLSCVSGIRKPDPRIFLEALSLVGTAPERAAYVGDTVSRDISGSKAAGYALAFQIHSFMTGGRDAGLSPDCPKPDYVIGDLQEVPAILEGLGAVPTGPGEKSAGVRSGHRGLR